MTNAPFVSTRTLNPLPRRLAFPKSHRLLKPAEFREVYDQGLRVAGPCFAAFCWRSKTSDGPKVGFTATKALGGSVLRNRMKRRVRECIRKRLDRLAPEWRIVFNLRRQALIAPVEQIESEVERVIERCAN